MRILSQDSKFDIEYENCHLVVNEKCCEIEAETSNPNFTPVMASYSSIYKCRKAMEMLHESYCGVLFLQHGDYKVDNIEQAQELEKKIKEEMSKPQFITTHIDNPAIECKIFKFPSEEELEV